MALFSLFASVPRLLLCLQSQSRRTMLITADYCSYSRSARGLSFCSFFSFGEPPPPGPYCSLKLGTNLKRLFVKLPPSPFLITPCQGVANKAKYGNNTLYTSLPFPQGQESYNGSLTKHICGKQEISSKHRFLIYHLSII